MTLTGAPNTASAAATLKVVGLTLGTHGIGYTSVPTATISGGGGTGATATATIAADAVFAITVTNGGSNYTTASVSFSGGGGGTLAAATASISGSVASVNVTNGGAGYVTGGIRKFVDSLPGLGSTNANNLGQYISVAVPDQTTYPGSDYYEIGLIQYRQQLSSDLPATLLRGYVQLETSVMNVGAGSRHIQLFNENLNGTHTAILSGGNPVYAFDHPEYLGTTIVAQKDRPVRVKFTNLLPTGSGGDLFIPVDTTAMGAGAGPVDSTGAPCDRTVRTDCATYSENRATLHLHGGVTPWISDGTPNQWITPAGETTKYPKGVSVVNVPDMPDPGPGSETFFYTNQQSARLMFYHDHAYGITRLNVYAGEAAGYLVQDPTERALVAAGVIPADEIPLIIQDKTFVPGSTQLAAEDPTWDTTKYGGMGNLWFPHVYMPNQNPYDLEGANATGSLGLRAVVLASLHRPGEWSGGQPFVWLHSNRGPHHSWDPQSIDDTRSVHGYAAGQRNGLSISDRRPEGVPLPDSQRQQRPGLEPAALLCRLQRPDVGLERQAESTRARVKWQWSRPWRVRPERPATRPT